MHVLDSHLHLWDPRRLRYDWLEGPLDARFAETELLHASIDLADTDAAVFIQADCAESQFIDEVRWVSDIADAVGVAAIVAGARLDRAGATSAHLDALAAHDLVVGVRHLLQGERDGLARSSDFLAGARQLAARGWTFDACVLSRQLNDVAALAAAVPDLRIALDHLGKPVVGTAATPSAPTPEWLRDLAELAQHPLVFCKLSGLPAEAGGDWSAAQVEPFLDAAAVAFGAERLMWGSDWPVSVIGPAEPGDPHAPADGSPAYQPTARSRWADVVAAWATDRGHDVEAIMWQNAETFYRRMPPSN